MKRMWSKNELKQISASEVKALVEGGTLDNAKPIYIHPISIIHPAGQSDFMCSILILNNDSAPIDTWAKLTAFFDKIYDELPEGISFARFPCTGFARNSTKVIITSVIEVSGKTSSGRRFYGMDNSNNTLAFLNENDITGEPRVFDGVNKIN